MEWMFLAVLGVGGATGAVGTGYSAPSRARCKLMILDVVEPRLVSHRRKMYGDLCCFYKLVNNSLVKYNPY